MREREHRGQEGRHHSGEGTTQLTQDGGEAAGRVDGQVEAAAQRARRSDPHMRAMLGGLRYATMDVVVGGGYG